VPNVTAEVRAEAALPRQPDRRALVADLVGLAASCLVVLVALSPVILGGRTLGAAGKGPEGTNGAAPFPGQPAADYARDFRPDKGASTWALEPWAEVTHRIYSDGEIPLWNPYEAAGAPHAANMQSAVFDPLLLAVNLHPSPLTWDLSIIAAFVLGAAAAYLFGRVLGLRVVPAVVSSATFALSGWFFLYSNNGFSRSYAFLPAVFLLVDLTLRSRRLWPVFGLGVVIAGSVYAGMPEASFFVIGAATVYAAVRLVQERTVMPVSVSVARLGGGGLLGVLLASPLMLLLLQYELLSFNVHKPGFGKGSEADPVWAVLHWIVPWFPEAPARPRNWVGAAAMVSALVAVSGRTETRRRHAWLFFALGGFLLLKIYDFQVLGWIGRLPVAGRVVFPTFGAPVVSFAFAVLAGIGIQVLWNHDLRLRRFLVLVAVVSTVLLAFLIANDRLRAIVENPSSAWGRATLFGLLAVTAVALAARLGRSWAALLLAGLVVAELFVLVPFDIYAKRADPYRTPGWMTLVRKAQGAEPHSRVFGIDGKLYPNTAGALGLQDIRVLDALYVERYWRYLRTFIQPDAYDRFTGSDATPPRFESNPMFDALGVRAVLSERDLANVPGLRMLGRDGDTRVYENTNAYPRAWVVRGVRIVRSEDDAFAFLEARARRRERAFIVNAFDPQQEAVVESSGKTTDRTLLALQDGRGDCTAADRDEATIERYSAQSVTVRVSAACAGLLVLPDTYFPGWKATVNGRESVIHPTNGAFRGVVVPQGTSTVVFRYQPRAFPIGILLAVAGLVAFALVALFRRRRGRNPRPPLRPRP
jgi:Bacterial membrane protein YfhO